jgi:hypothetical protein
MVVSKRYSKEQLVELKEIRKIWKEFEKGKCKSYSEEEFFKAMKEWSK